MRMEWQMLVVGISGAEAVSKAFFLVPPALSIQTLIFVWLYR